MIITIKSLIFIKKKQIIYIFGHQQLLILIFKTIGFHLEVLDSPEALLCQHYYANRQESCWALYDETI